MVESFEGQLPPGFEYMDVLGAGGYGCVYLARQLELDRPVAIKLLEGDPLTHADEVRRFEAEAKLTAQLHHPGIVTVLDFGVHEGRPWIAYEHLDGGSLDDRLDRGPLPPAESLSLVSEVAFALQEAHDHGVVHRDIKPTNLMRAEGGRFKLIDFGIARWTQERARLTQPGHMVGTPGFMSPEQIRGEPAGPASDIYSLGVLLYLLLTGREPFRSDNPKQVLLGHLKEIPPAPSSLNPALPPRLDKVVLTALEKDPAIRYPSARDMGHTLARYVPLFTGTARGPAMTAVELEVESRPAHGVPNASRTGGSSPRVARPQTTRSPATPPAHSRKPRSWMAGASTLALAGLVMIGWKVLAPDPPPATSVVSVKPAAMHSPAELPAVLFEYLGPRRVSLELVLVRGGTFRMGSPDSDPMQRPSERPVHEVHLRPFYIGRYEVTQDQYEAIVGTKEYRATQRNAPVQQQNIERVDDFCRRLAKASGKPYRLPSEAEWEYACRAGGTKRFGTTDDEARVTDFGWVEGSFVMEAQDVGRKPPNAFGLHDMMGNVKEWIADTWHPDYTSAPTDGRAWIEPGSTSRFVRGGAFLSDISHCRCSVRDEIRSLVVPAPGFRVALDATGDMR